MSDDLTRAAQNTDREIWRGPDEGPGDYADSIFVTESGSIGINCGGHVVVLPLPHWHALANEKPNLRVIARLAARHGYSVVPDEPDFRTQDAGLDSFNLTESEYWRIPTKIYRVMVQAGRVKPE